MRLEIRVDNAASLALFSTRGYTVFGRHHDYYDDGADALRLQRGLGAQKLGRGGDQVARMARDH